MAPRTPTTPRGYRPPPQTDRLCRRCPNFLQAFDRDLCASCQNTQDLSPIATKPPSPAPKYFNEWSDILGSNHEDNQIRAALESQRSRMREAARLKIARALREEWDTRIGDSVRAVGRGEDVMMPVETGLIVRLGDVVRELEDMEDLRRQPEQRRAE